MPTSFTKGDLFETAGIQAYAFGASLDGTMDSGIASAIKKRWPECAAAYAARCEAGKFEYGDVFAWSGEGVTVFALGIQQTGEKPRLLALSNALRRMFELAAEAKIDRIGLPRIGAGPGGLDWTRVRKMLGEISVGQRVRLDVFEQFVRSPSSASDAG